MLETRVWSLGREDPLEKIWQPTPVLSPGKSHGQRILVGYSPWGRRKLGHDWVTLLTNVFGKTIKSLILHRNSVQSRCSVVSDSLQPHGLQHARLPCPSPTPRVYSNSCPLCWWCHPTISSSVVPFSSRLQSFPAPGSLPMSRFFTSGDQSIGVSASASVLPMNL